MTDAAGFDSPTTAARVSTFPSRFLFVDCCFELGLLLLASRTVYAVGGRRRATAVDASRRTTYSQGQYSAGDHAIDD